MTPALELDGVGLRFGIGRERLADIALTVAPGTVATVAGPAGSGKTLLVEIAALVRRPSRGSLRLFGRQSLGLRAGELAALRRRIGWVEADPPLLPGLHPVDATALPLQLSGMAEAEATARAVEMLRWLGEEGDDGGAVDRPAARRAALARAVVNSPELVMVDELAAMPGALRLKLLRLVTQLGRQGTAFLFTSRDEAVLASVPAANHFHLSNGRLQRTEAGPR